MDDITRRQQVLMVARIHCVGLATICILYAAYAAAMLCFLEAQKAVWSPEETTALVDYLYKRRSRADRRGNFSIETFAAAAEAIWPLLEDGPEKTEKMCKTKWTRVSGSTRLLFSQLTHIFRSSLFTPASRNIK